MQTKCCFFSDMRCRIIITGLISGLQVNLSEKIIKIYLIINQKFLYL